MKVKVDEFDNTQYPNGQKLDQLVDPMVKFPQELIFGIFSLLNLASLRSACGVSKEWNVIARQPILWKKAIYKMAFDTEKWGQYLGKDMVTDEDDEEKFEEESLPLSIVEDYRSFYRSFPRENINDSLMLVRLPKIINRKIAWKSLETLGNLIFPFQCTVNVQRCIWSAVHILREETIERSCWVLFKIKVFSKNDKGYNEQKAIIVDLAKKASVFYKIFEEDYLGRTLTISLDRASKF